MQVQSVRVMQRKNLGNYEHKEVDISVSLVEGEDADLALSLAQEVVNKGLGIASTVKKASVKTTTTAKTATKEEKPVETKEEVKEAPAKKAPAKKAPAKKHTKEECLEALREYATKKGSKEAAVALMEDVTGVSTLGEVAEKDYNKLYKALTK